MTSRKRAYAVLAATALVFFLCLWQTLDMGLDKRATAMLPEDDPLVADATYFMAHVPATELLYLQIKADESHAELLAQAGDDLYAAISKAPWIKEVFYQFTQKQLMAFMSLVREKKYRILTPQDWEEIQRDLTPQALDQRMAELKAKIMAPSGLFSTRALVSDPLGLAPRIMEKMNAFSNDTAKMNFKGSRIISPDGTRLLMIGVPVYPASDTARTREMIDFLRAEKQRLEARFDQKIHIGISGAHISTLDNATTIQADVERALLMLSVGILVLGLIFFGRFSHVLLIFVPTLVSLTAATALLTLFHPNVSAIALGCGAVLMGITVDFGIHLLFGVDQEGRDQTESLIRRLKRPIATGAATTMAAFGCLMLSSLPGQRQMGMLAVLGIFIAATFTLFVLKYFIGLLPQNPPKPARVPLVRGCAAFMEKWGSHPALAGLVLVLVVLTTAIGLPRFQFRGDLSELNHLQPETQADMDDFMATWSGASPTLVLVRGKDPALAQEENDHLYRDLLARKKAGQVDQIGSLSAIFPGPVEQERRYQTFRDLFSPQRRETLRADMADACRANGFVPGAFAPFFKEMEKTPTPLTAGDFQPTVVHPLIQARMITTPEAAHVLTTLTLTDPNGMDGFTREVKAAHPSAKVVNYPHFVSHITQWLSREFKRLFGLAALAMVGVLLVFQRQLKTVLVTVTPVICAALTTAGVLGITQIPVNLISIIFITFVFGVGVDFSIFLVHHEMRKTKGEPPTTAGAVIICALTTMGAFACLIFARHSALFSIGVAGLTGMVTSLGAALILIPFLVKQLHLGGADHDPT